MFSRQTLSILLTLAAAIHGQEQEQINNENLPQLSHIIHEEFLPVEEVGEGQSFLRGGRELQTTCQAFDPRPLYVCGTPGGPPNNRCQYSSATCNGLTYGCSCGGVAKQCNYCEIRLLGSIVCQIAGTSSTVSDTTDGIITCQCISDGDGGATPNCYKPTPYPVALPTFPPDSVYAQLQPVGVPAPVVVPAPVFVAPPVVPQYSLTAGGSQVRAPTIPVPVPTIPVPVPTIPVPVPTITVPMPTIPVPVQTYQAQGSAWVQDNTYDSKDQKAGKKRRN